MSTPHFPGWYPDPDQPARERLWDGQAWTHHLRKAAGGSGGLSPRTIALAIGSGVLGLLVIVGLAASGSDRDPADTAASACRIGARIGGRIGDRAKTRQLTQHRPPGQAPYFDQCGSPTPW